MIAFLALLTWLYLILAHGRFWSSGPQLQPTAPRECPAVDIIVPARDEVETIGPVIRSLVTQDYPGTFHVTLVDDNSTDGTATAAGTAPQLRILRGQPKPAGWSGKLWALSQAVAATNAPLILLTDADIVHDRRHLSTLVSKLTQSQLVMVSEMVRLNCSSFAERALVPAFVYFFQMLYPFARVNNPRSPLAAAAGGTILLRRETLEKVGGIESIKHALIDDVTLAASCKRVGPLFLGHSGLATSIRPYQGLGDIWQMVARTAFTQLRYSAALLMGTLLGLMLLWWVPALEMLFGTGWRSGCATAAFLLATVSYFPTLRRYGRNPLWAFTLPLIASFYMAATLGSALTHWFGSGSNWKNRAYGAGINDA